MLLIRFFLSFFLLLSLSISAEDLRVATSPDYPPYEFYQDGKIVGLEIDIVQEIAKRLGRKLVMVESDFSSLIGEVQSHRTDMAIAAISITEEREKSVDFTIPYDRSEGVFLYNKSRTVKSLEDIQKMIIGVQLGSTHEKDAEILVKNGVGNGLKTFNKVPDMLQDLKNGSIQGMVLAFDEAQPMLKAYNNEIDLIFLNKGEDHGIVLPKGHPLLGEVNRILMELKVEGAVKSLKKKWNLIDVSDYQAGMFETKEMSYIERLKSFLPSVPFIVSGILVTFKYALLSVMFGLVLGTMLGICKIMPSPLLKRIANLYTSFFRGTPLLVQLGLIYFGTRPLLGFNISVFAAGILTFSLNSTAYISEIIRAGLQSIEKGQWEASYVLGISKFKTLKMIILPQAFSRSLPSLVNEIIDLVKESALISTLGEADVLRRAYIVASEKYLYFEPLLVAALVYYIVVYFLGRMAKRLEGRMSIS